MIQHKIVYGKSIRENIYDLVKGVANVPQGVSVSTQTPIYPSQQPTIITQTDQDQTDATIETPKDITENVILAEFQVAPLDLTVSDYTTPTFYLTMDKLFFAYDDLIEEYRLGDLEFNLMGEEAKFAIIEQFTEARYQYSNFAPEQFKKMKDDEALNRLSMNESGQLPKSYVLRRGQMIAKPYQNWAMSQTIINMKNGIPKDTVLEEMIHGNFSQFNTKTLLLFAGIFIGYIILTAILSALSLPTIIRSIVDLLFGGVTLAMLAWTYLAMEKNNKRFYSTYLRYK